MLNPDKTYSRDIDKFLGEEEQLNRCERIYGLEYFDFVVKRCIDPNYTVTRRLIYTIYVHCVLLLKLNELIKERYLIVSMYESEICNKLINKSKQILKPLLKTMFTDEERIKKLHEKISVLIYDLKSDVKKMIHIIIEKLCEIKASAGIRPSINPVIELRSDFKTMSIENIESFRDEISKYGALQYMLCERNKSSGGIIPSPDAEWTDYTNAGIMGMTLGSESYVAVRYAGKEHCLPTASTFIYNMNGIHVPRQVDITRYPASWKKINMDDSGIKYSSSCTICKGDRVWVVPPGYTGMQGDWKNNAYVIPTGDSYTVTFTGTGIDIIAQHNIEQGVIRIEVDDEFLACVDTWGEGKWCRQLQFRVEDLNFGEHMVKVTVLYGKWFTNDYFIIYGAEIIPEIPLLVQSTFDREIVYISNIDIYSKSHIAGELLYRLSNDKTKGTWSRYIHSNGIADLIEGRNTIEVRYAGKKSLESEQPFYYHGPDFHASKIASAIVNL